MQVVPLWTAAKEKRHRWGTLMFWNFQGQGKDYEEHGGKRPTFIDIHATQRRYIAPICHFSDNTFLS
jgi:hypothetical protein